jgi:DNA-binding MarR family transcriptional regulator
MSGRSASTITCPHCRRPIAPLQVRVHLELLELREATVVELAEKMAVEKPAISGALSALKERGLVERIGRGLWRKR